jgi:hypothetical protein
MAPDTSTTSADTDWGTPRSRDAELLGWGVTVGDFIRASLDLVELLGALGETLQRLWPDRLGAHRIAHCLIVGTGTGGDTGTARCGATRCGGAGRVMDARRRGRAAGGA